MDENMISFKEFTLLSEALGTVIGSDFGNVFKQFHPTYKRDGKSISFDVDSMDKDGLVGHLKNFFGKRGTKIKIDKYDDDVAAYKMNDDNIAVIKEPKQFGNRYQIDLKFSF
jgi:hypothetical protein